MKNRNLKHSDNWATPEEFYNKLNNEFNFDFDPCPLCYEEITPEKDGLLVEPENIEKLSAAITRMIENDNMRIEMSGKAVKNSERFLIKKICTEWDELFKEIVLKK